MVHHARILTKRKIYFEFNSHTLHVEVSIVSYMERSTPLGVFGIYITFGTNENLEDVVIPAVGSYEQEIKMIKFYN